MGGFGVEHLVYYLIAINLVAFAAFGIDKMLAEGRRRRISEWRLLSWAALGGTPGAYAGRQLFRHKTRKNGFSDKLHLLAIAQTAGLAFLLVAAWPA